MIEIRLIGHLKNLFKKDNITIDQDIINIDKLLTSISTNLTTKFSLDPANLLILVNNIEISALSSNKTKIKDGDIVTLIPTVHGG